MAPSVDWSAVRTPAGRVRAAWRVAVPVVGLLVGFALLADVVDGTFGLLGDAFVNQFLRATAAVGVLVVWARAVDRRPFRDYGLALDRDWAADFLAGAGIATAIHFGALLTLLGSGWATVEGWFSGGRGPFLTGFVLYGASRLFVAVWEEAIFRALFLRNTAEGLAGWLSSRDALVGAWAMSSVVFGVIHLNQAPSIVAISFWVLLGLVLGLAYAVTGELGLPMGFHFAYNLAAISVFNVVGADPTLTAEVARLPAVVRLSPASGPPAFDGIAGWVNVTWGLVAGLLVVGYAGWRYGFEWRVELAEWVPRGE